MGKAERSSAGQSVPRHTNISCLGVNAIEDEINVLHLSGKRLTTFNISRETKTKVAQFLGGPLVLDASLGIDTVSIPYHTLQYQWTSFILVAQASGLHGRGSPCRLGPQRLSERLHLLSELLVDLDEVPVLCHCTQVQRRRVRGAGAACVAGNKRKRRARLLTQRDGAIAIGDVAVGIGALNDEVGQAHPEAATSAAAAVQARSRGRGSGRAGSSRCGGPPPVTPPAPLRLTPAHAAPCTAPLPRRRSGRCAAARRGSRIRPRSAACRPCVPAPR